jgi:hypothetical protein
MKTISYVSTRSEVWRYYWRAWARPAGLWRVHVLLGLLVAFVRSSRAGSAATSVWAFLGYWLAGALVCILLFPLFPLVRFKPQLRLLTIDQAGWTTEIGKLRGSRSWNEVLSIEDDGNVITIVGVNRNALIVPRRAFSNDAQRRDFLESARGWHASAITP